MPNKVLVTGASGLLGVAALEKFRSAGWDVVGVSRRKPELPSGRDIEFLSVDLRNEEAARAAFEPLSDVTHIAYTALHEMPELVAGWSSKEQIEANNAMLRNVVEPIVRTASNFQHISILQGNEDLRRAPAPDPHSNMPTGVAAYLEENADVWDQIVAKCDLRSRNLRELIGQGDQHADFAFAHGALEGPRAFVSTIKLRQAGFTKTIDTADSFRNALHSLIDHKLLPPAAK